MIFNRFNSVLAILLLVGFLFIQSNCGKEEIPVPPGSTTPTLEGQVAVWRSNKEGSLKLLKIPDLLPFTTTTSADVDIVIDDGTTYQSMDGFGAAITGSSAFVIQTHLAEAEQDQLLQELFNPETGIGINFIRLTMGASDFSLSDFTYNDQSSTTPEDLDQENFDLSPEDEYLIPLLQKIVDINPDINIMATPWSAPAWMKTTSMLKNGGNLRSELYDSYATYFVKYIQGMEERNIPIHSITVQNEPLYAAPYISMEMSAEEQKIFIRDFLGPKFESNEIDTKIIIYDHNWDDIDYPLSILNDANAKSYVAGTAFHCYAGDVSAMSQVHSAHPDVGIYFTECSGGDFAPDYGANLSWNTENLIVGATRNWSKSVLFWNLALDQNHGPKNGGCQDCRGVVTIDSNTGSITKNEEFVLLGHAAKFIRSGAKRIATPNTRSQGISQVAFKNLDETIAIIAFNHNDDRKSIQFKCNENAFNYNIEPGMLVTFVIEQ